MAKKKEVSQKIMKNLKQKAQLQSLEKEYSDINPSIREEQLKIPTDNSLNTITELVEIPKSEGGIMVFLGKKVFGIQMWILLTISIIVITIISIVTYNIVTKQNLCKNLADTKVKMDQSAYNYNQLLKSSNLSYDQLKNKLELLNNYKAFYENLKKYKGTDMSTLDITTKLQNNDTVFINSIQLNTESIKNDKNTVDLWVNNNNLYNKKGCGGLTTVNIILYVILILVLISIYIFIGVYFSENIFTKMPKSVAEFKAFQTDQLPFYGFLLIGIIILTIFIITGLSLFNTTQIIPKLPSTKPPK
jgi:hypothetical protein